MRILQSNSSLFNVKFDVWVTLILCFLMFKMGKTLPSFTVSRVTYPHFKVKYHKSALKCYASMVDGNSVFPPCLILSFVLRSNHLQKQVTKINEDWIIIPGCWCKHVLLSLLRNFSCWPLLFPEKLQCFSGPVV